MARHSLTLNLAALGIGATLALGAVAPAHAADVVGTWERDNGGSKVKFTPCGKAVCGSIAWLKPGADAKAKVGQQVFFDMMPTGADTWEGKAFNPEDGKTYSGKMTLSGSTLTTAGCVLGGLICKSVTWKRAD